MRIAAAALTGFLSGLALWVGSFRFTGVSQPWSAGTPTYVVVLFVLGAVLGAFTPRAFWVGPLGLYLGEALGLASQGYLVSPTDPPVLYPIALLFLASYSMAVMAGAALAAGGLRFYRGL
jgi:hypothetical protein